MKPIRSPILAGLAFFLGLPLLAYAQSQTPTGVTFNTGAMIADDLGTAGGVWDLPLDQVTGLVAGWVGPTTLYTIDTSTGLPAGSNASNQYGQSVSWNGLNVGLSLNFHYFVGSDGNLWLDYTAVIGGNWIHEQINTKAKATLINGQATASNVGPGSFSQSGSYDGVAGTYVYVSIPITVGYWDGSVYYVTATTETVDVFIPLANIRQHNYN